jgi:hypothetical protein
MQLKKGKKWDKNPYFSLQSKKFKLLQYPKATRHPLKANGYPLYANRQYTQLARA